MGLNRFDGRVEVPPGRAIPRRADTATTLELLRGYRERVEAVKAFLENPTAVRDKCINRSLPHERMRPLLNDISVTTRDQLTAFFDLNNVAARLEPFVPATPEPDPKRTLGRRELFNRIFKLPKD